jgi:hypothetical protein
MARLRTLSSLYSHTPLEAAQKRPGSAPLKLSFLSPAHSPKTFRLLYEQPPILLARHSDFIFPVS